MQKNRRTSVRNGMLHFSDTVLLFFFISFLGWAWETVYFLIQDGEFCDRGFLTLPFCPIYGSAIFLTYFMIGTPNKGQFLLKRIHNKYMLHLCYFLMAVLIPTAFELLVGWFFDTVLDVRLWSYSNNFLNFRGYICLSVSLFWGFALTLAMKYIFPKLRNLFLKIPRSVSLTLSGVCIIAVITDAALCFIRAVSKIRMYAS